MPSDLQNGAESPVEADALTAYLRLLERSKAPRATIYQRRHFLQYMLSLLKDGPKTGTAYRKAVDKALDKVASTDNRSFFLAVAREFYPLWIGDIKGAAQMQNISYHSQLPDGVKPETSLDELVQRANSTEYSSTEEAMVTGYVAVLREFGIDGPVLANRERICRMILLKTRGLPPSGSTYRVVCDTILPLFTKPETKLYYLGVAREFYYFWSNDPSAPDRLRQAATTTRSGMDPVV